MQYVLLFLEGIITFASPCHLPLLPVFVTLFAAGEANNRKTILNAVGFVTGFTIVFVLMGAFAGTVGRLFLEYTVVVNIVTGLIVIIFGFSLLGVVNIGFLNRFAHKHPSVPSSTQGLNFFTALVFGLTFSVTYIPCAGAFLGSALMMASQQGGTIVGILMLLTFSLGLGLPYILSAVLIDRIKNALDVIKRNFKTINRVAGCVLIVVGILMATGLFGQILEFF